MRMAYLAIGSIGLPLVCSSRYTGSRGVHFDDYLTGTLEQSDRLLRRKDRRRPPRAQRPLRLM